MCFKLFKQSYKQLLKKIFKLSNKLIIPYFYWITFLVSSTALIGSIFIEHVILIEPCILCTLQRVCFVLLLVTSLLMLILTYFNYYVSSRKHAIKDRATHNQSIVNKFLSKFLLDLIGIISINIFSLLGLLIAARQSWLQIFHSHQISFCSAGLKTLLREYNILQIILMAIEGKLSCSAIGMRILGLSLANWGLVLFSIICILGMIAIFKLHKKIFHSV